MKPAMTPGEILLEDYLIPMGISQNALARALGISPQSINEIVLGRRSITPEMSLKLGKFFKQSAQFWFNIQTTCDFRQLHSDRGFPEIEIRPAPAPRRSYHHSKPSHPSRRKNLHLARRKTPHSIREHDPVSHDLGEVKVSNDILLTEIY
jgi:addiction module HigA family antidote